VVGSCVFEIVNTLSWMVISLRLSLDPHNTGKMHQQQVHLVEI
jgi:hypothetical protein